MQALDFYLFLFSITFVQGFQWSCWPDSQLVPPCFISLLAIPISKQLIVHLVKQPVFPNEKKKKSALPILCGTEAPQPSAVFPVTS